MTTTIFALANRYVATRPLNLMHANTLTSRVRQLADFAKTDDPAECCQVEVINRFLARYAATHSPATVKGVRGDLLTVWRYAADHGLADQPDPRQIRIRRVPQSIPECYTVDEVRQLIADCPAMCGDYNQIPRSLYFEAIIRLSWESGLRLGDCWAFRSSQLDAAGRLVRVSRKTGLRTVHQLTEHTSEALRACGSLAWPHAKWTFQLHFRQLRDVTVRRGTFKWLRRASGSYVASLYGESAGASHLGHSSISTFRRYYDHRLVEGNRPAPPKLD